MHHEVDRFPDDSDSLSPAARDCRDGLVERKGSVPAPYGLLLHSPEVAEAFDRLSTALWQGDLPKRITEGLFLLNAHRHRCRYQWVRHVDKALDAGLASSVVARLAIGEQPPRDTDTAFHAAWLLAAALEKSGPVDDALYEVLQQHFGPKAIAELAAFCGFASMVSNALRVRQPGIPVGSGQAPF